MFCRAPIYRIVNWNVDATGPAIVIDSPFDGQTDVSLSGNVTFHPSPSEPSTTTFEGNLDGAGFVQCDSRSRTCNYSNLTPASTHQIDIRGTDQFGNIGGVTTSHFTTTT